MNFEQLKCQIIFDILPNYSKAIYDTLTNEELKEASRIYFKRIYDQVFQGEKLEISSTSTPTDPVKYKTTKECHEMLTKAFNLFNNFFAVQ